MKIAHFFKTNGWNKTVGAWVRTIAKKRLFKYIENFTTKKETFQIKESDIFHISAQNIDCVYSLEPLRQGGPNEYPLSMLLAKEK